mmetsp:Transcript_28559/g.91604  ORF Transcript_28559/g.91604 Transcript_28559/m.91604 type:complete len:426 (-) Transcript_28559:215-1492(-)
MRVLRVLALAALPALSLTLPRAPPARLGPCASLGAGASLRGRLFGPGQPLRPPAAPPGAAPAPQQSEENTRRRVVKEARGVAFGLAGLYGFAALAPDATRAQEDHAAGAPAPPEAAARARPRGLKARAKDKLFGRKLEVSDLEPPAPGVVRVFLCRHGETEYNRLKLVQGRQVDAPLNSAGVDQARALGEALRGQGIRTVASSQLKRAKETADIAARGMAQSAPPRRRALASFDEVDFGAWEGKAGPVVSAGLGAVFTLWGAGTLWAATPGGETLKTVLDRFGAGLDELTAELAAEAGDDQGTAVAIVAHSALIKAFLCSVGAEGDPDDAKTSQFELSGGAADSPANGNSRAKVVGGPSPMRRFKGLRQKNCCINVLDYDPRTKEITIRVLNETKHLKDLQRPIDEPQVERRSGSNIMRLLRWRS